MNSSPSIAFLPVSAIPETSLFGYAVHFLKEKNVQCVPLRKQLIHQVITEIKQLNHYYPDNKHDVFITLRLRKHLQDFLNRQIDHYHMNAEYLMNPSNS